MRSLRSLRLLVAPTVVGSFLGLVSAPGCSGSSSSSGFGDTPNDSGVGGDGSLGDGGGPKPIFEAGSDAPHQCQGLECQIANCGSGPKTSVSGTVYDPAGNNPLYNVIVYVPNAKLDPFPTGISCDKCGVLTSGSPVVTTLTGPDGKFKLDDVPVGTSIPLVFQIGKWRRQITIPTVTKCQDNPITDKNQTRLPKNSTEGDIPQIAVVTGGCDVFECLLRNIGIDDKEFTDPLGPGRIHIYQGEGGSPYGSSNAKGTTLWSNAASLSKYDLIINSCECSEQAQDKPAASLTNMFNYANKGGRIFNTHYQYYWINHGPAPFPTTANWYSTEQSGNAQVTTTVNQGFPKGQAFAHWLLNTGASSTLGQLTVDSARYNASGENPPSTKWLSATYSDPLGGGSGPALMHYTFNTPVGVPEDQQCGKVLFSDFHVIEGSGAAGTAFPGECSGLTTMTGQQKALEFMLFDLSSCIQKDTDPPKPPPPR